MPTKYPTRKQIEALPVEKLHELAERVGLKPPFKGRKPGDLVTLILSIPGRWEDGALYRTFFPEGASSRSPGGKSPNGGKAGKK